MQTTVALVESPGQDFTLTEVELDDPRADEVLVRIVATGLCHTDITMRSMLPTEMFPNVFGHEGTGIVERVGAEVSGIEVGDHVVLSLRSCRACAACRAGHVGHCEQTLVLNYLGYRLDGTTAHHRDGQPVLGSFFGQSSFARHAIAHPDNCVVVDPTLDLTLLAPYGCAFQTGAGTVLNVLQPTPEDSLVVHGVGAVGLAAVAAAVAEGVETVIAVDLVAERLEAAAALGATPLDPASLDDTPMVDRLRELTGGGARYAIDTTAAPTVVREAMQALGPRGTLVALGLGAEEYAVDAVDLLQGGKTLTSSIEGDSDPLEMVPRLLALRAEGRFDLDHLVRTYPFADINQAVADLEAGKVIKAVLVW